MEFYNTGWTLAMSDIDDEEPSWDEFANRLQESPDPAERAAYDIYMSIETHYHVYRAFNDTPDYMVIEVVESWVEILRKAGLK